MLQLFDAFSKTVVLSHDSINFIENATRAFGLSCFNLLYFYFFLPLVPIGVAGGHSCLSAARWVAWRRDIP